MDRDAMIAAGCLEEYADDAVKLYEHYQTRGAEHSTIMNTLRSETGETPQYFNYMQALDIAARNGDMKKFKALKKMMKNK